MFGRFVLHLDTFSDGFQVQILFGIHGKTSTHFYFFFSNAQHGQQHLYRYMIVDYMKDDDAVTVAEKNRTHRYLSAVVSSAMSCTV